MASTKLDWFDLMTSEAFKVSRIGESDLMNEINPYLKKLVISYEDGSKYTVKHANLTLEDITNLGNKNSLYYTLNKHTTYGSLTEKHCIALGSVRTLEAVTREGNIFVKKINKKLLPK